MNSKITIIGSGCMGLSCGLQLISAGFRDVTILSRDFTPHTTSDGAGALWRPFGDSSIAASASLFDRWGNSTFYYFLSLLREFGSVKTGILTVPGIEVFDSIQEIPYWAHTVIGFRILTSNELNSFGLSNYSFGFTYTSIIVDMRVYLPFIQKEFIKRGGKIIEGEVKNISTNNNNNNNSNVVNSILNSSDLLINCSGLGSRELLNDSSLIPIRGQLVYMQIPSLFHFFMHSNPTTGEVTYIFPRSHDVVVGGTYEKYEERKFVGNDKDENIKKAILDRAVKFVPELAEKSAFEVREWSGLRPAREFVRLELENGNNRICISPPKSSGAAFDKTAAMKSNCDKPIIHNYGHGGSGMTLHWGCASDVLNLTANHFGVKLVDLNQFDQANRNSVRLLFPNSIQNKSKL